MSALRVGATIAEIPDLPGTWSIWSQSSEAPGAYFVVPADPAAKATGAKFAVVKATQKREVVKPVLEVLRVSKDGR